MTDIPKQSDATLVSKILDGQTDLYEEVMLRYQPKLLRYATFLVSDPDAAADIVQDTFIKAYQNMRSFNPKYKFSSWIYRIAHNESMNYIKKQKRLVHDSEIDGFSDTFISNDHTAEDIDEQILGADVQNCLRLVEPKHREVLVLHYMNQLPYKDISGVLHMPVSTVGVKITRAKKALKAVCLKNGVQYG